VAGSLNTKYYQPVLVTPRTYFVFTPLLAGTAVGTLEFRTAMESSHSLKNVAVVRGWATDLDIARKQLSVEGVVEAEGGAEDPNFTMPYDKLVVAVGAYAQTFNTPGVREHAFFLKDVNDARRIRRRILERFEEAALPTNVDAAHQEQLLNFAIIGGGPTGIEFAAELHDLLEDDLSRIYPQLVKKARITVYDVSPTILSMFDTRLQTYAQKLFQRQGIQVRTNHHVLAVEKDALVTKEDGRVPVGMVVWSTGLATNPFVKKILAQKFKLYPDDPKAQDLALVGTQKTGQIVVDTHLRVLAAPVEGVNEERPLDDMFALGDCVAVKNQALPATAQVANQQARWLAKALNKAAKREALSAAVGVPSASARPLVDIEKETEFRFRSLGVMAYLGGWRAITQSGGADVKGRMAWLLWRTAYLTKSVSWRNRILIPVYW
jgi:NADH dehydrogenase FAD-containing subunit